MVDAMESRREGYVIAERADGYKLEMRVPIYIFNLIMMSWSVVRCRGIRFAVFDNLRNHHLKSIQLVGWEDAYFSIVFFSYR